METPAPAPSAPSRGLLLLAFAAVFLVWGTTFLAIRYAVETIPPLITAGVRHGVAGTVLFSLAWLRGYRPRRSDWIAGSVIGALFFLAGHGLLHWAELHIASGLAALLIATEPLWILALGAALARQRLSWASGLGLLLGLAGVALLTLPELGAVRLVDWGIFATLASSLAWSLGVVAGPLLKLPEHPLGRAAVATLTGGAMLLVARGPDRGDRGVRSQRGVPPLRPRPGVPDQLRLGDHLLGVHLAPAARPRRRSSRRTRS